MRAQEGQRTRNGCTFLSFLQKISLDFIKGIKRVQQRHHRRGLTLFSPPLLDERSDKRASFFQQSRSGVSGVHISTNFSWLALKTARARLFEARAYAQKVQLSLLALLVPVFASSPIPLHTSRAETVWRMPPKPFLMRPHPCKANWPH